MVATTGTAIWERMMDLDGVAITPEAARSLLALDFLDADQQRMSDLSDRASEGTLAVAERAELEEYVRAGHMLALVHSKARIALTRVGRP